jgi:hypothetical protein
MLNKKCLEAVKEFYKGGQGLKSKALKNYTSGDGTNLGFENLMKKLAWYVVDDVQIDRSRIKIHGNYFDPPDKKVQDPQRLDLHVQVDGKYPLIIEVRAWIDKPFYTLKRAVVRNFMELDYVRPHLTDDVKFIFVGLCIDILPRLRTTLDQTQGYGDRVYDVKFSPQRRGHKKGNYFDHGVRDQGIQEFVALLRDSLAPYATSTAGGENE